MACDLTGGRKKPCKDAVGGISKIYFVDFGDLGTVTTGSNDEITNLTGTFTYYTYDVRNNSSLETNIITSTENGTTYFEQVLNVTLHKLTKEDNKELKLMAFGRPHVFVETQDGQGGLNVMCVGLEHGAEVTGGTAVTGTAMGDMQGYTLTLTATETTMPNFVATPTAANPFDGLAGATETAGAQRQP